MIFTIKDEDRLHDVMEMIYDIYDDYYWDGDRHLIDIDLAQTHIESTDSDVLFAKLSASLPERALFKYRKTFVECCKAEISRRGEDEPGLFSGLD